MFSTPGALFQRQWSERFSLATSGLRAVRVATVTKRAHRNTLFEDQYARITGQNESRQRTEVKSASGNMRVSLQATGEAGPWTIRE